MSDYFTNSNEKFEQAFDLFGQIEPETYKPGRPYSGNGHIERWIELDGSPTPRKKGDLYWKKVKALINREFQFQSAYNENQKLMFFSHVFSEYNLALKNESIDPPDGNEFKVFPLTAIGRDNIAKGLIRAMRARDTGYDIPGKEGFSECLSNALSLCFKVSGVDEKTGKSLKTTPSEEEIAKFFAVIRQYEAYFEKKQIKCDRTFKVRKIELEQFEKYSNFLPEAYMGQLLQGTLYADAFLDEEMKLVAVVIYGVHFRWKELVWIAMEEHHRNDDSVSAVLAHLVMQSKKQSYVDGIFMELNDGSGMQHLKRVFDRIGVNTYNQKNNIYEFTLKDVKTDKSMISASRKMICVPIDYLSKSEKRKIEQLINTSDTPVPVRVPIQWNSYRGDLSYAYLDKEAKTAGLVLLSEAGNSFVIELLYASNSVIVAALLGSILGNTKGVIPADKQIVVPIVTESTRHLVKKLVPNAKRGDGIQAIVWFD